MGKERADKLLVERGLTETRAKAQALIMAGKVFSADRRIAKAGDLVAEDAPLEVKGQDYRYDWQTDGAWEGTCRQLTVQLDDNVPHTVSFKFKK